MSGWRVESYYSARHGWETVTREETRAEALARLREYRENEPGYRPGAALERLATAARSTTAPGFEGRREVERDVATVRAALDDRAAAWRIAEAASEAAADMRRVAGYPMGGPEA